jgi:hypothetical protein
MNLLSDEVDERRNKFPQQNLPLLNRRQVQSCSLRLSDLDALDEIR